MSDPSPHRDAAMLVLRDLWRLAGYEKKVSHYRLCAAIASVCQHRAEARTSGRMRGYNPPATDIVARQIKAIVFMPQRPGFFDVAITVETEEGTFTETWCGVDLKLADSDPEHRAAAFLFQIRESGQYVADIVDIVRRGSACISVRQDNWSDRQQAEYWSDAEKCINLFGSYDRFDGEDFILGNFVVGLTSNHDELKMAMALKQHTQITVLPTAAPAEC